MPRISQDEGVEEIESPVRNGPLLMVQQLRSTGKKSLCCNCFIFIYLIYYLVLIFSIFPSVYVNSNLSKDKN